MTASARHHRVFRRLAAGVLAIAALGLTTPLAAADTPSAEQSAPASSTRPAPAPKPVNTRPVAEKPAENGA